MTKPWRCEACGSRDPADRGKVSCRYCGTRYKLPAAKVAAPVGPTGWHKVGDPGEPYPNWLRACQGKSGVYAIRREGLLGTRVVYVGESHTGNLYKTLVRHFQSWRRGPRRRRARGRLTSSPSTAATSVNI